MELSHLHHDILTEIINIGIGGSANSLNKIINRRVRLRVPKIEFLSGEEFSQKLEDETSSVSAVTMPFKGELTGNVELIFSTDNAIRIVDAISPKGKSDGKMDYLSTSTLNEFGNIILNALVGTMGNLLKTRLRYSIPRYVESPVAELFGFLTSDSNNVIYAETQFDIEEIEVEGSFILFLEVKSFSRLLELLDGYHQSNLE